MTTSPQTPDETPEAIRDASTRFLLLERQALERGVGAYATEILAAARYEALLDRFADLVAHYEDPNGSPERHEARTDAVKVEIEATALDHASELLAGVIGRMDAGNLSDETPTLDRLLDDAAVDLADREGITAATVARPAAPRLSPAEVATIHRFETRPSALDEDDEDRRCPHGRTVESRRANPCPVGFESCEVDS